MSGQNQGRLTTHVLNTATGFPAQGLGIALYRLAGSSSESLGRFVTNDDGRVDCPLLEGTHFTAGEYELVFDVQSYFNGQDSFFTHIPIRFVVDDANRHYHVPLLLSPYGYSTYRGS